MKREVGIVDKWSDAASTVSVGKTRVDGGPGRYNEDGKWFRFCCVGRSVPDRMATDVFTPLAIW